MKRTKIENKIYMLWSHIHELPRTGKDMNAFDEEGEKVAADVVVNKGVLGQEEAGKNVLKFDRAKVTLGEYVKIARMLS